MDSPEPPVPPPPPPPPPAVAATSAGGYPARLDIDRRTRRFLDGDRSFSGCSLCRTGSSPARWSSSARSWRSSRGSWCCSPESCRTGSPTSNAWCCATWLARTPTAPGCFVRPYPPFEFATTPTDPGVYPARADFEPALEESQPADRRAAPDLGDPSRDRHVHHRHHRLRLLVDRRLRRAVHRRMAGGLAGWVRRASVRICACTPTCSC